ncbi:hypothetical protein FHL15_007433 [Xylaria flabelliformis]|uniref:AA1-like domain-containing protein n=1 Tax=Xylaria flabelliformis TaxID=2512241 RepID=A0A553HUN2_9PEZI|nr:hypothetical protein FHL15_007433 [Xylaria flabelliformis]
MHRQIASAAIALVHLILPRAQTHVLPSPSSPLQPDTQPPPPPPPPLLSTQTCPTSPKSFSLSEITYLRYEVSQNVPTAPPNTTQLVFEITNTATEISTGCALQTIMSPSGDWIEDDAIWYTCLERTIVVDDKEYPVRTSARLDWDEWRLAVNQTVTVSQFSTLTLTPTCTENKTASQYIKECSAPDVVVTATSDDKQHSIGI